MLQVRTHFLTDNNPNKSVKLVLWSHHFAMSVQNPSEALLSFEGHLLDEPVQSLGLGLRDRKGRREEAVSMTNIHLTHLVRTQHRIYLLLQ